MTEEQEQSPIAGVESTPWAAPSPWTVPQPVMPSAAKISEEYLRVTSDMSSSRQRRPAVGRGWQPLPPYWPAAPASWDSPLAIAAVLPGPGGDFLLAYPAVRPIPSGVAIGSLASGTA